MVGVVTNVVTWRGMGEFLSDYTNNNNELTQFNKVILFRNT